MNGDAADAIDASLPGIREALATTRRAIVVAPPGAGKTTRVPLALLDESWLAGQRIVMLEPRRLATRAAARRMAHLLSEDVGDRVGYQTRDERRIGKATRIEVVTEGILTRRLQNDPELPGVGLVIFDEVHERNLTTDLGIALTLDVAATLRPDLGVMAMSATPDTKALVAVLDAPVIVSDGRMFPVDHVWIGVDRKARIVDVTTQAVVRAVGEQVGDVLVFLPGIGEIRGVERALAGLLPPGVDVFPLAGALTVAEQDAALAPSAPGRRRVVLSTDIAETSLTVDGVRVVVDSGLARSPRFDVRTGMTRLTTVTTSRASAEQRAGRAGRLAPGVCYRLWSKVEHGTRVAHRPPEIDEVDLAGLALELAAWGTPAEQLPFPTPPPAKALRAARELLHALEALESGDRLTDIGRRMVALPVHPRLARMLVAEPTALGCVLAAAIDERDVLRGRVDELPADLELRLRLIAGHAGSGHDAADRRSIAAVANRAGDIARRLGIHFDLGDVDASRAGGVLLHAFPDRLAVRRRPGQFQLRSGTGAWVPDTDPIAHEPFVVAVDLDGKRDRSRIRLAAGLDADDVANVLHDQVTELVKLEWDADRDDLVERVERRLDAMKLGEVVRPPQPGDATLDALVERVVVTRLAVLGWSKTSIALRQRVEFLHRSLGSPWPDWGVDHLVTTIDEWLRPYLAGSTSRADLERLDLAMVLRSQLPWPDGAQLDELAPAELRVANGRTVSIDYGDDRPAAHVRVQDMFGTTMHPTAGGVPIVLHLLSPADRPIQITSDLPGFWSGSWSEVRKQLAGRYPKHHWPDDPAGADPTRLKPR